MNDINKLIEVLAKDLSIMHEGRTVEAQWPINANKFGYFSARFFIPFLENRILELKKNHSDKEIASLFKTPSKLTQIFHLLPWMEDWDKKRVCNFATMLLTFISYYKKDIFCKNGENVLINKPKIEDYKYKLTEEEYKKLNSILICYSELISPLFLPFGREIHGPYNEKGIFIIKHFFDLNPSFIDLQFPIEEISILEKCKTLYKFDFFNHTIQKGEIENAYTNKKVDIKLLEKNLNHIIKIFSNYTEKDWISYLNKKLYYSFKDLSLALKESWLPPKEVEEFIKNNKFPYPEEDIVTGSRATKEEIYKSIKKGYTNLFINQNL